MDSTTPERVQALGDWTDDQARALDRLRNWKRAAAPHSLLTVGGAHGTGKSSILTAAIGDDPTTAVITPTAKAARVLVRMGVPHARTIHSTIYSSVLAPLGDACKLCGYVFRDGDHAFVGEMKGNSVLICDGEKNCRTKVDKVRPWRSMGPRFMLRERLDPEIQRIAVDEGSMVDAEMLRDIMSFNLPVLGVLDPRQLPPVSGRPGFSFDRLDIELRTLHRQAADSPIVLAAEMAWGAEPLPYGDYGDALRVVRSVDDDALAQADQVISGTNKKRLALNRRIRQAQCRKTELPEPGDRVVCLKNNYTKGLINGMQFSVEEATTLREPDAANDTVQMKLRSVDEPTGAPITVSTPEDFFTKVEASIPWIRRNDWHEFTFANAITTHKAQGSGWPSVVVFDQSRTFARYGRDYARRWLYTAITRAARQLILVR